MTWRIRRASSSSATYADDDDGGDDDARDADAPAATPDAASTPRAKVGKQGFFSKQRPIKIDLRPQNTLDLRDAAARRDAGVDPARGPR